MANRVAVTLLRCWTPRLFDYLDPEEGRIYNDLVMCKCFEELKAKGLSNATAESPNR